MNRLRWLLPLLALAPAWAQADSGARSDPATRALFLRLGSIWVQDPGFDLLAGSDALPRFELGAGLAPGPASAWTFELSYGFAGLGDTTFETLETQFALHQFQGAAVYRLPISRTFRLLGRGLAAFELAHVSLDDGREDPLSDTVPLLAVEGALGLELLLPLSQSGDGFDTHLDLSMEVGYGFRPWRASFDRLNRSGSDGLPQGAVQLGALDLSGWVLRFGGALRF